MRWETSGFQNQKKLFEAIVAGGRISHAYIFQGPDQIGK
jgi:DNA polymerase III gamma/tau subunit